MTTITTSNMFYLGNLTPTDPTEGNYGSENAGAILGAYSKPPIIELTSVDQNDDGVIRDDEDNPAGDYISYDVGSGVTSQFVDSTVYYAADVLLGDGSTISITLMVIQTQNGDTFAVDLNATNDLENQAIQSITLTGVGQDDFGGHLTANTINGASTVCFCMGTMIATPRGDVPVEQLRPGDLVITLDHGPQPIIWTHRSTLYRPERQAPITFEPRSLGKNVPARPLRVSPQHRLLMRSKIADRIQGNPEVLIAAKDLINLNGVQKSLPFIPTTYCHFACRNHEIVFANGTEAETFLMGSMAEKMISAEALSRLLDCRPATKPARPIIRGRRARNLLRRHIAHESPMCRPLCRKKLRCN